MGRLAIGARHSFTAYIDEAGDEGFKFDPQGRSGVGSSHWFILSAVLIRASYSFPAIRALNEVFKPIERARGAPLHFKTMSHEQRVAVICGISKANIRVMSVCIHKAALKEHGMHEKRRLYFWATRLLLERISWFTRDNRDTADGLDGACGLVFSRSKSLSYQDLLGYLHLLKSPMAPPTQIVWQHVSMDDVEIRQHHELTALKAVDAVASGYRCALELSSYGYCEDRFARLLKRVTYCRGKKYKTYGLKIFPDRPPVEKDRDFRYGWIGDYWEN